MDKKNEEKLLGIIIKVFDIKNLKRNIKLEDIERLEEELHWDSLAIISMIAACESEFGIVIDIEDYEKIKSIETIKSVLSINNL